MIVAEAVWQYSHHVLGGLRSHEGPVLTVGNWSPEWPGLVGLLNLNASLTKCGRAYSTTWTIDGTDDFFENSLKQWLETGSVSHDTSHVRDLDLASLPEDARARGAQLAEELRKRKAIMGIFDEGCMGMYNAFFDDEYLNPMGIYKERLSQSALFAEMGTVADAEAKAAYDYVVAKGMSFDFGADADSNGETELTPAQVLEQCKMYIAAGRIANDFGCDMIGIQYQQGLKDTCVASDLAEGLLNNVDRPPIKTRDGAAVIGEGNAIVHFNEVDEGAAVDALVTNRVWRALGLDPATTLHDVRYGEEFQGEFIWVMEISGSVPPSHIRGGYQGCVSERQPPMYFPRGGGTIKGVSKAGWVVWSRVFLMENALHADIGLGECVELPAEEEQRRSDITTPQWPTMNIKLPGISRDQFMARHKANHAQFAYGADKPTALQALHTKAAMFAAMGIQVHLAGEIPQ